MKATPIGLAFVVAISIAAGACGHKGPPVAPVQLLPHPVDNLTIERANDVVTLRFVVPALDEPGGTPTSAPVERIEVFAVSEPADATKPTVGQVAIPPNLVATIEVRREDPKAAAATAETGRPAAGEPATYVDKVKLPAPSAGVRHYAIIAIAGRRRAQSPLLTVPLSGAPATPTGLKADYSEASLDLTWTGTTGFVLDETDQSGANPRRLAASMQPSPAKFAITPFEFGKQRCFVIRGIQAAGPVSLVSESSAPLCVTPVDRFPPPAASSLLAVPVEPADGGGIDLSWTPPTATDLAGYLVVRWIDGTEERQTLTPAPITTATYHDQTARAGVTYAYHVLACDTARPSNCSGPSNVRTVTARGPGMFPRVR